VAAAFGAGAGLANGSYLAVCGGTYSWDDFVKTLNTLGHNFGVVRVAPEVYDGFFPGAKELREMSSTSRRTPISVRTRRPASPQRMPSFRAASTVFSEWARKNMKPGGLSRAGRSQG